jgi:putative ABC transport system substrate-binding protein
VKRREFIAGLGSAAAWPLAAGAQQVTSPVVGYLDPGSLDTKRGTLAIFLKGLAETGYVEGQNVTILYRWADDRTDLLPELAADLVRRQVSVIVASGNAATALAAKGATQEIPIVFGTGADPVQIGLVASLRRPGANLTGVTTLSRELGAKRFELIHELVPAAALIAYLINPANSVFAATESSVVQTAARTLGVRLLTLNASTPDEIDVAFESLIKEQVGALLLSGDVFFQISRRAQVLALTAVHRIPTIYNRREVVAAGGLLSYGIDPAELTRQVGVYTGRILKGEKPADLPVQQATKVELVINTKTAKTLGLTIPLPLLARADEVIE